MLHRIEDENTVWTVKYFYDGGVYAEIKDASWIATQGEVVLVNNRPKLVGKIVWDLWNCEIFIYLKDKNEND